MDNTNEDIDIAEFDLKDFLVKNDAQLDEGQSFDTIMEDRVIPTVQRRKLESDTLIKNSIKYMEELDEKMSDISINIVNFFRGFATRMDTNKEKLNTTEINFKVNLAQCGDHHDDIAAGQEEELAAKVKEMTHSIHHVQLNEKLQDCFDILDSIQRTYRSYNAEYIKIVQNNPDTMNQFYDDFEADICGTFSIYKESR